MGIEIIIIMMMFSSSEKGKYLVLVVINVFSFVHHGKKTPARRHISLCAGFNVVTTSSKYTNEHRSLRNMLWCLLHAKAIQLIPITIKSHC